ncbi:hypothetical protein [Nocardioides pyridinolyticus]
MTAPITTVPPTSTCPSWCRPSTFCDRGEHLPDLSLWPTIEATADPEYDGTPKLGTYPLWAEGDSRQPAVALYLEGSKRVEDVTVSLTPDEALELAAHLVTAAEAVKAG